METEFVTLDIQKFENMFVACGCCLGLLIGVAGSAVIFLMTNPKRSD